MSILNKLYVSFRITFDDPDKYNSILSALDRAVRAGASRVWDETTSFYFVETTENSTQFATRVRAAANLRASDLLVVVNMNGQGATIWGAFTKLGTLQYFLPSLFRVPPPMPYRPGLGRPHP